MAVDTRRVPAPLQVIHLRQSDLTARARAAAEIAKVNAAAVDAEARFPERGVRRTAQAAAARHSSPAGLGR